MFRLKIMERIPQEFTRQAARREDLYPGPAAPYGGLSLLLAVFHFFIPQARHRRVAIFKYCSTVPQLTRPSGGRLALTAGTVLLRGAPPPRRACVVLFCI